MNEEFKGTVETVIHNWIDADELRAATATWPLEWFDFGIEVTKRNKANLKEETEPLLREMRVAREIELKRLEPIEQVEKHHISKRNYDRWILAVLAGTLIVTFLSWRFPR